MTTTADDYGWFIEDYALGLNFCLTFVRGGGPEAILSRLGGRDAVELTGTGRLEDAADIVTCGPFHDGRSTGLAFLAATAAGEWTMLVEPGGWLCTQDEVVHALSRPGEMVSLYYNENNDPRFLWARDGTNLVDFNPTSAGWREGTGLDDELVRLGFDLSTWDPDADELPAYDDRWQARSLALMHHLTGVRLTAALLAAAVFRCAAVIDPFGRRWVTADPATIAPYSAEELAADIRARLRDYASTPPAP